MKSFLAVALGLLMFVGVVGFAHAQTATPTMTTTPTPTTTVPGGAPTTGFGK